MSLANAPVFHPSPEEFDDPLRYLASIRPLAEPYGICKVVPPAGWSPPCVLKREELAFGTRVQLVHELQHRDFHQAQSEFYEDYDRFLKTQGKKLLVGG